MPRFRTFYDELGVGRDAAPAEIKRAFRETARLFHPDVSAPEDQERAHERMSRLNLIADTLLDPESREIYDDLVRKYEVHPPPNRGRTRRQIEALYREFARVSVEIMNLSGRYSNCRLKMLIGGTLAAVSILAAIVGSAASPGDVYLDFIRFFALVGLIIAGMGLSDLMVRARHLRRIRELEWRQSELRRRMYSA